MKMLTDNLFLGITVLFLMDGVLILTGHIGIANQFMDVLFLVIFVAIIFYIKELRKNED